MYVCVCVAEWSICTGLYGYKGGTYTPIDVCTPAPLWVFVGVFTFTQGPRPTAPLRRPPSLTDPSVRTGGGASAEANQSLARHQQGEGLTRGAGVGVVRGAGLALPGLPRRRQAPQTNMAVYLHSAPARPMGGRLARVPGRRRGQLRRCPRWRQRGAAVPGRCCRACRGRALPRQGARHRLSVCHPVPGHPLVLGRCILLATKKRTLWSVSSDFSVSACGVGTGSLHRPACPSWASGTGTAPRRWRQFLRLW